MTIHSHTTRAELAEYCQLCHEHGIKSVRLDKATADAVKRLVMGGTMRFLGIKFKVRK